MDFPKTNSIESAFRPAFEEISRRSNVAQSFAETDTSYFPRSTDPVNTPFRIPNQQAVLVSMGTSVLAPRPEDASRPALRVYGAFPTREDAKDHAQIINSLDDSCSLVIVKQGEWILFPQNEHVRDDLEANKKRCQQKLQAHRVKQAEDGEAFDRCVKEHIERPPPKSTNDEPEDKEEQEEAEGLVYKPPKRIRAGAEVRGQSIVALCVIPDEFGECLFKILGCFENSTEADKWIQNVGSRKITDDDIYVTSTCEWIYPNGTAKEGSNHYRIDELQRIMDAAARNPEMVQSYKDWKKDQDEKKKSLAAIENVSSETEKDDH